VELQQCPEAQGAGSIITSANDYIKCVKALMNHDSPFTEDMYKHIIKPRIIENPSGAGREAEDTMSSYSMYALGWSTRFYRGHMIVEHDGGISGHGSTQFFIPSQKFAAVIFGNSSGAQDLTSVLANELIDEVLEVPTTERPDWNARFKRVDDRGDENRREEQLRLEKSLHPNFNGTYDLMETPLSAYTGEYWSKGYHTMVLEVKDGNLFISAYDRSMPFYLTFEHIYGETKFVARLHDGFDDGGDVGWPIHAEFVFTEGKVKQMGLNLEEDLDGLIWFSKTLNATPS
jgi:hypothetical protein